MKNELELERKLFRNYMNSFLAGLWLKSSMASFISLFPFYVKGAGKVKGLRNAVDVPVVGWVNEIIT